MKRFFCYWVMELNGIAMQDENSLNTFGKSGYELVAVVQAPDSSPQKPKLLAYLKNTEKMEKIPREPGV
jgi:hypothetical protein